MTHRPPGMRLPVLLVALGAAVFALMATSALGEGLTYYRTPTEIATGQDDQTTRLRLGGLVRPGSVRQDGRALRFAVTDGVTTIEVAHLGERPPVFGEGREAVLEGVLGPGMTFRSDRLMVKHSEEYRAGDGPG